MAHEIESTDGFGFVGKPAWHGLGSELEQGIGVWEAFKRVGLDWETQMAPITAHVTLDDGSVKDIPLEDFRAHFRMDNLVPLACLTKGYKPISQRDLAEFTESLTGADQNVIVETAGSLRGGRRIFTCVKLPKTIRVTGEDVLDMYVLVSNAHDGSATFSCYPTSVRVVCANTLRLSERDSYRGVAFKHQGDIKEKIEEAQRALGIIVQKTEVYEEQVKFLASKDLTSANVFEFFNLVADKNLGIIKPEDKSEEAEKARKKRSKIITAWEENMDDERQTLTGIEGTLWAAFNAVTQWHDHERGRFGNVLESTSRVHSNLFGASNTDKQQTFKVALELAKTV